MTIYYDPKEKKAQPWVFVTFVIIPILITLLVLMFGQKRVREKVEMEKRSVQMDVFDQF